MLSVSRSQMLFEVVSVSVSVFILECFEPWAKIYTPNSFNCFCEAWRCLIFPVH